MKKTMSMQMVQGGQQFVDQRQHFVVCEWFSFVSSGHGQLMQIHGTIFKDKKQFIVFVNQLKKFDTIFVGGKFGQRTALSKF